jgi:predicted DNA-binding transcriptional regulator YafY
MPKYLFIQRSQPRQSQQPSPAQSGAQYAVELRSERDDWAGAGRTSPEFLALFEEALSTGVGLGFDYTGRAGRISSRRIEPHGLLVETPV